MKIILTLLLAVATLWADEPITPPKPPTTPVILNSDETREMIWLRMHFPVPEGVLGSEDNYYTAPTQELIDDLLTFFKARKADYPWLEEVFDCDDKATELKYLASIWSVRQWRGTRPGVLVGKAYVHLDGDYSLLFPNSAGEWVEGYHVLNFVVRNDGEIFFIEPQTGCIAEVSSFIYEGSIEVLRLEY